MSRTANREHLFCPVSCCSKGQSISLFYQPILGLWHCSTSITSHLNLLFFVLETPEVIDQRGTFVALFTKWAFKMIFNTFCCSLFLLFFQVPVFFISFPALNQKCSPDKRSFWWQKEMQERLICTRKVFYGLNIFCFSCLVFGV